MNQHAHSGFLAVSSTLQNQRQSQNGIDGIIMAGSYNPADGTVQVVMAHTVAAAAFTDPAGNQIYPTVVGAQLEVDGYGDQYGPVGGERCVLRMAGTKYTASLQHNDDDSPGAPSGERWSVHRGRPNGNNPGTVNAWWKLTNDGATPGDALGGYKVLAGGQALVETAGGITLSLNDTGSDAMLEGAASMLLSVTGGGSIAFGGTQVLINGATSSTAEGVVTQAYLEAFLIQLQAALAAWASTNLQGGSGASGPTLSFIPTASSRSFAI